MTCSRCDSLLRYKLKGQYSVLIYTPLAHSLSKLKHHLREHHVPFELKKNLAVLINFDHSNAEQLGRILQNCFSQVELEDAQATLIPANSEGHDITDYLANTYSLKKIVGMCLSQWLVSIIDNKYLTTFCQPIVDSKTLIPYGYECLLRAQYEGHLVSPSTLFETAQLSDMLFLLDKQARICHIENMSKISITDKKIFINFNPTAIYDPLFCLRTTNTALKKSQINPSQIVFEVIESHAVKDKKHLLNIIDYYRRQDYGVALDDLGSGYSSLNLLVELNPDYIKIDQNLVESIHENQMKQILLEKICEMALKLDIKVICEGLSQQEELDIVKQYPIHYYQGFLFGKPVSFESIA
ncbi:TPA: EAL domain-containing protein [Legionella pneumophila]